MADALGRRGLTCETADVAWIDPPSGVRGAIAGRARALVRASASGPGDPSDLYLVEGRLSPEGAVLWIGDVWDVTNTSGVDESRPVVDGPLAAYTASADGLVTGVHVLDLRGPPAEATASFTAVQRLQAALTNLQQTGQTSGIEHTTFAFDPVASHVDLSWRSDGALEVRADARTVVLDPARARVADAGGADFVRVVPDERSRPGNLVTWAVDRLRAFSWFGDDRMQWLKAVAFTALDKVRTTFGHGATAEEVRDEIGLPATLATAAPAFADPEIGWPPPPIAPIFSSPLPGEGRWISLDQDPFITRSPGGTAPAFVTSYVRPDKQRPDVRVYVTLWDPRQVALHIEAGTVEPISATGEHGTGMIPRDPGVMRHVVAAFNGGFQAQHGEYGMQANGIEYLPPKPYAATVVELRDGSNGFGAWPESAEVPADVVGMRQNLTALVEDGKFNPWGRTWWGGAPPGWPDQVHTARSALCLTREGFTGYFYSASISAQDLADAMLAARCSFGIHLDMNAGHAGFEFYDVAQEGELAPMSRPLQGDWEAQGKVPDMPGYVFRARRMIRGMGHMLFPRYIQRESRDFFFLTSRDVLPGAPIPASNETDPDEGRWRTRGLPQHGFPYAMATSWVRGPSGMKIRVVRADPRTMRPAGATDPAPTVLTLDAPAALRTAKTLWWGGAGELAIGAAPPSAGAQPLLGGCTGAADACAEGAHAGVGVQDADGMLVWVELPPDAHPDRTTAQALDDLLAKLGCTARMAVPGRPQIRLGGELAASGDPVIPSQERDAGAGSKAPMFRFVRAQAPGAHAIFPDTPIVPIQVWQPLQMKRVRYFSKPKAAAAP